MFNKSLLSVCVSSTSMYIRSRFEVGYHGRSDAQWRGQYPGQDQVTGMGDIRVHQQQRHVLDVNITVKSRVFTVVYILCTG